MIVVTAQLKLAEGCDAEFVDVAKKLVEASRLEAGCAGYELLKQDVGQYCFLERYVDEDAVEVHRKTDHYRTLGRQLGAFIVGKPEVMRYSTIV